MEEIHTYETDKHLKNRKNTYGTDKHLWNRKYTYRTDEQNR